MIQNKLVSWLHSQAWSAIVGDENWTIIKNKIYWWNQRDEELNKSITLGSIVSQLTKFEVVLIATMCDIAWGKITHEDDNICCDY